MRAFILTIILSTLLVGCASRRTKDCFVIYNLKTQKFEKVIGEEVCRERVPACSTFKVPLAVMAFDAGVLKDENQVLKWDGVRRDRKELNRDHNARTWLRDSVVWFSQVLTPQLGEKRLKKYLHDFAYGNENLSAGITEAWLVSPREKERALALNAYEQIEFFKRLWTDALPVAPRAMKITRDLIYLETSPRGWRLSGKTGSNFYDEERKTHLGWFVGNLQRDDQSYLFATNFSDLAPTNEEGYGGLRAKELTKLHFDEMGLW